MTSDRLYFKQLLSGRDFAHSDQLARQMVNFVYLIGDRESGEAVVVDPAYGVDDLIEILGIVRRAGLRRERPTLVDAQWLAVETRAAAHGAIRLESASV